MDINYGLVIRNEHGEVIHFVGYSEEPTVEDAEVLKSELRTDPEFGLQNIIDELAIEVADDETVNLFKEYVLTQM